MRADLADELDNMELIAGDGRIIELAEIADLCYNAAELIVLLDSLAHCGIGNINTEALFQGLYDLEHELCLVVIEVGLVALHGRIDLRYKEAIVLDRIYKEEVLFHTLHGSAALGAEQCAEVVVSTLDGALKNGAGIRAGAVCHVVVCDIAGRAIGSAQS